MSSIAEISITYIGTATLLIELGGVRILTDPVFDPAGRSYQFGWGTSSTKTNDPAMTPEQLGVVDLVLLSHDQHEDNLDDAGKRILGNAKLVLTTVPAARRLGGRVKGIRTWHSETFISSSGLPIKVSATPARHGPPLSRPFVGKVTGFMLEWPGQTDGALYISGDTVLFRGIKQIAKRFKVGTAILHLGAVQFPTYGPLRFTFSAKQAARTLELLDVKTCIPVHYDGWKHFREGRDEAEVVFAKLAKDRNVIWLEKGVVSVLTV